MQITDAMVEAAGAAWSAAISNGAPPSIERGIRAVLEAFVPMLRAHDGWQPIETLPNTGELVFMLAPSGLFIAPAKHFEVASAASRKNDRLVYEAAGEWPNVKHTPLFWMPSHPSKVKP